MLIGQSPQLTRVKKLIREVAKTDENLLIIGEAGSGKQTVGREIHARSRQKNRPFVMINCTALGDTISEAELFGETVEGSLGVERKIGLLEQAKKGILYLENIQDLKPEFQEKFVNILKEHKFHKVGEKQLMEIHFRVIATTVDKNISRNTSFRADLLSILDNFIIQIYPLRERKQDIPYIFTHYLEEYCKEFNREVPPVPADLFESLIEYEWPGNDRELKNAVRNLVLMSPEGMLSTEYLPFEVKKHPFESLVGHDLSEAVDEVEKYLIKKALRRFAGNQTKAANALHVSEAALRYKMKKFGLSRKAF